MSLGGPCRSVQGSGLVSRLCHGRGRDSSAAVAPSLKLRRTMAKEAACPSGILLHNVERFNNEFRCTVYGI